MSNALQTYQNKASRKGATACVVGWVKQYQKFEIEHFTGCGGAILPKQLGRKLN